MCSNSTPSLVHGVTINAQSQLWLLSLWEWHPLLFSRMERSTQKHEQLCKTSQQSYMLVLWTWGLVLQPELALHELPPSCLHIQFFLDARIRATRVPACRTPHRWALSICMQLMEIKHFSEDVRSCSVFSKYSISFCKIMTPSLATIVLSPSG